MNLNFCSCADAYVMCNGCKSPDTILTKENRPFFLRCEQVCNSASGSFMFPLKTHYLFKSKLNNPAFNTSWEKNIV
jgi:hypothetical protein